MRLWRIEGKSSNFFTLILYLSCAKVVESCQSAKLLGSFPCFFSKIVSFKLLSKLKLPWESAVWITPWISWEPIRALIFYVVKDVDILLGQWPLFSKISVTLIMWLILQTAALDGETDLKTRVIPSACMGIDFELLHKMKVI